MKKYYPGQGTKLFFFPWTYFFYKMYTNSKNNNMLYIDPVDVTLPAFPTLGCTWQTCQSLRRAYLETQMKGSLISPKWERYENKDISIVKDNIPKLLPAAPFFGWIKNKLNFYSNFQIVNKKCHFQNSVNSLDYLTLYRNGIISYCVYLLAVKLFLKWRL